MQPSKYGGILLLALSSSENLVPEDEDQCFPFLPLTYHYNQLPITVTHLIDGATFNSTTLEHPTVFECCLESHAVLDTG